MPTRGGNATLDDYKAVLDELSEIIEKYRSIYDIYISSLHQHIQINLVGHKAFNVKR
jgi:hypothetical protein